eukprot:Awhi_evm1s14457
MVVRYNRKCLLCPSDDMYPFEFEEEFNNYVTEFTNSDTNDKNHDDKSGIRSNNNNDVDNDNNNNNTNNNNNNNDDDYNKFRENDSHGKDCKRFQLEFLATENSDTLSAEGLREREERERKSLESLKTKTMKQYCSLEDVGKFLFLNHNAYNGKARENQKLTVSSLTASY